MTGTRRSIWLILLAGASVMGGEEPPSASAEADGGPQNGIVARVNDEPIFFQDLEHRLKTAHGTATEAPRNAYDIDRLLTKLVNDELFAQQARILEMQNEPGVVRGVEARRRGLVLDRLEQDEITSKIEVTEEEVRETFERDYSRVTLEIITVDAREEAEGLRAELEAGADFESLARERSVDQYSGRGGKMENALHRDFPFELGRQAWSLEPGELGGPIRTGLGWSVIHVVEFFDADAEHFEVVRGSLARQLEQLQAERLRLKLGVRLRETFEVSVDLEALETIDCEKQSDGRLAPVVGDRDRVLARIGDREITAAELERPLRKRWRGMRNREAALAARRVVLQRLVRDELMRVEAQRREYDRHPDVQRTLRAYEKELLVDTYVSEVVAARIDVDREEIEKYYDEHRADYRKPPRLHLGQITVEEKDEAERLAELLRQGTDLAWLARQHSIDRFKDAGGDRGWITPASGGAPEELLTAQPGDVFGPAGVPGNFIVIKIDAREEQGAWPVENVAEQVRSRLFATKLADYLREHVTELRERSEIVVYEDVLASMTISGTRIEDEPDAPGGHGAH